MALAQRPVTGPDHIPKDVLTHGGLVFTGHLHVPRLRQSASEIVRVFPELDVVAKRKWLQVRPVSCVVATVNLSFRRSPSPPFS